MIPNRDPRLYNYQYNAPDPPVKFYWFVPGVRYVGWVICVVLFVLSLAIISSLGMSFGLIKCFIWSGMLLVILLLAILLFHPMKAFLLSFIRFKNPPVLEFKKIPVNLLTNPYSGKLYYLVQRRRMRFLKAYCPLLRYRFEHRARDIQYHMELRKIAIDIILLALSFFAIYELISLHQSRHNYYSTLTMLHMVNGTYRYGKPLRHAIIHQEFIDYINFTLIPTFFPTDKACNTERDSDLDVRYDDYTYDSKGLAPSTLFNRTWGVNPEKTKKKKKRPIKKKKTYSASIAEAEGERAKRQSFIFRRGYALGGDFKIMGVMRLRQLRVKRESCALNSPDHPTRTPICYGEYNVFTQDRESYGIEWDKDMNFPFLSKMARDPWIYRSACEAEGIPIQGKIATYPGGGYILNFPTAYNDCKIALEFIESFKWIDIGTRAIIIEFTMYITDSNIFNVIHLLFEKSASGSYISTIRIDTGKFLLLDVEKEGIIIGTFVFLIVLIYLLIWRHVYTARILSMTDACRSFPLWVDMTILIFGILTVIVVYWKNYYTLYLIRKIDRDKQNYDFFSFGYIIILNRVCKHIYTVMIFLLALKSMIVLRFRDSFLHVWLALRGAIGALLSMALFFFVTMTAFALFFHLSLNQYLFHFSNVYRSFCAVLTRMIFVSDFNFNNMQILPSFVGKLAFYFLLFAVSFILISFLFSVILYHIARVKDSNLYNKYNDYGYLKHLLTKTRRSDVVANKIMWPEPKWDFVSECAYAPHRLRGGGGAMCKQYLGDITTDTLLPPAYWPRSVLLMRYKSMFAEKKPLDINIPGKWDCIYRIEAMKRLTVANLSCDCCEAMKSRDLAIRNLAADFIYSGPRQPIESYYIVKCGSRRYVMPFTTLVLMQKALEKFSRSKMTQIYCNAGINLVFIDITCEEFCTLVKALEEKVNEFDTFLTRRKICDLSCIKTPKICRKKKMKDVCSAPDAILREQSPPPTCDEIQFYNDPCQKLCD